MINIISSIKDAFLAIIGVISNLISGIFYLLRMIPSALGMLTYSMGYMPTVLIAFGIGLISISVVYLIIGR